MHASRTDKGWREYGEDAAARVGNVRDLLAAGLRVEDIARLAPCLSQDLGQAPACDEAIETYASRVAELDARLATLQAHRAALAARLEDLRARRDGGQ